MALEIMQSEWASSLVDFWYTEIFPVPAVTTVSF